MYGLLRAGAIESVPIGRMRRIRPADLEKYVAGLAVTTPARALPDAA